MSRVVDILPTPLDYAGLSRAELDGRIRVRKEELKAVILGHNYQRAERALRRMLELSGGWSAPTEEERHLEEAGLRRAGCGCA